MTTCTCSSLCLTLTIITGATQAWAQREPGPAHVHGAASTMSSRAPHDPEIVPLDRSKPFAVQKIADPRLVPPHSGPGPMHARPTGAPIANQRAIIFVGGKQALNPQPIPPGHAVTGNQARALNPQPIPPGHEVRPVPHPLAPPPGAGSQ